LIKEGLSGRAGQKSEKSPQTRVFSESTEHLCDKEGLDVWPRPYTVKAPGKDEIRAGPCGAPNIGDRFWGAEASEHGPPASMECGVRE
jgi:hypothetical protein